jgi:single-stranded-DNA-specific exonuclease
MNSETLLNILLENRGITDALARGKFLSPKYTDMYDPYLMHDMDRAVARIARAVEQSEKICIYSDYDADGIPGNVILHDFFAKIEYKNIIKYIPHRHTEGYGLHMDALDSFADQGVKLIITVDLGITAVDECARATELGIEVIITDHHEPLETLPDAYAIVNPKLGSYPDTMLCGAGVAFKLVQALCKHYNITDDWEKRLLDLAGLSTLSDMVPLVDENRVIAYGGMKFLQKSPRPGLRALYSKSGLDTTYMTETDIVFSITPRLNAASRMDHGDLAFEVLSTRNHTMAEIAAEHISLLNDKRKKIVTDIMKKLAADNHDNTSVIVIGHESWNAGILGIIAGKIQDKYKKIAFVWGGSNGSSVKGSVRGNSTVSVVEIMSNHAELLEHYGGHHDAGGFSVSMENKEQFFSALQNIPTTLELRGTSEINHEVIYDAELPLSAVTDEYYQTIRKLAPFGMGNPEPVFLFKNIEVVTVKQFGKTQEHFEIIVRDNNKEVKAIKWFATEKDFTKIPSEGHAIDLYAKFEHSVFRGKHELRLQVLDVQ